MRPKVAILVPRREGFPERDRLWAFCRRWWQQNFPRWPVVEGHHNEGLFNRSAAVNLAAGMAGDWDVAVIIDADVICDPDAVREAVAAAPAANRMINPFTLRKDLDQRGTERVLAGYRGNWSRYVRHTYPDTVSSVVVVSRALWEATGGFDEAFVGWGFEDNAFEALCETFGAGPRLTFPGEVWHLWHPTAKGQSVGTETFEANKARALRYRVALGDPEAMRAIRGSANVTATGGVPPVLHRVVPEKTSAAAEAYWRRWQELHPDWQFMTHRDPLNPADWPLTAAHWHRVTAGAQFADLIRLEALVRWGGVYVDQDMEPLRNMDSLLAVPAFAAYEDRNSIPNAVLGARAGHPAMVECLDLALERLAAGQDIWHCGPGVTTAVLPKYPDVLLLPPGSFYPYHYSEKHRAGDNHRQEQPWAFAVHHWWHSWKGK